MKSKSRSLCILIYVLWVPSVGASLISSSHPNHEKERVHTERFTYSYPELLEESDQSAREEKIEETQPASEEEFECPLTKELNTLTEERCYEEALALVDEELACDCNNVCLLYWKAVIHTDMGAYDKAVITLNHLLCIEPCHPEALELWAKIKKVDKHCLRGRNKTILYGLFSDVNSPDEIWTDASFQYVKKTECGSYGLQINHASRLDNEGLQYQVFAYPKFGCKYYAYLSYAHSEDSSIWPDNEYEAALFVPWCHGMEFSFGADYSEILATYLWGVKPAFKQDVGYYTWGINPIFYVPKSGKSGILFKIYVRRNFDDPDHYVGVALHAGEYPDLADLTSVGFFLLDGNGIFIHGQFPIRYGVFVKWGFGYETERFPSGFKRERINGLAGLMRRF